MLNQHGSTGYIRPLATCKTMGGHCIPLERYGQPVSWFCLCVTMGGPVALEKWPVHPVHHVQCSPGNFPSKVGGFQMSITLDKQNQVGCTGLDRY